MNKLIASSVLALVMVGGTVPAAGATTPPPPPDYKALYFQASAAALECGSNLRDANLDISSWKSIVESQHRTLVRVDRISAKRQEHIWRLQDKVARLEEQLAK